MLPARADLVSLPAAVLLQRTRLARQLAAAGIGFTLADNAFLRIDDWERAQTFADALAPKQLHRVLDRFAQLCCPVMDTFDQRYHWSLTQVEYAIDLVFSLRRDAQAAL